VCPCLGLSLGLALSLSCATGAWCKENGARLWRVLGHQSPKAEAHVVVSPRGKVED
jgi:hypothetical protein